MSPTSPGHGSGSVFVGSTALLRTQPPPSRAVVAAMSPDCPQHGHYLQPIIVSSCAPRCVPPKESGTGVSGCETSAAQ
jgi:hypothetical protein